MNRPHRVVVVYSRVGGGHQSAAKALGSALKATSLGQSSVRLVDVYVECGRFPVTRFPAIYAELARNRPGLWSLIYQATPHLHLDPATVVGPFLRIGIRRLLESERPDLVVSVIPAVNGILANEARGTGARVEVVLTDWHSIHRFWVARGVDHYTASTESSRNDCISYGAPAQSVDVVGIPVRREFNAPAAPKSDVLHDLGLDPRCFTVLAMVGAEGSPRAFTNIAHLAASDSDAQLIVVCGRNEQLRRQVERMPSRMSVRAVGFVENVADLMRAADVLITKAGGVTLAEAFCSGVPVVVHDVVPGQEAGNLVYVLQHDAAVSASNPWELVQLVAELKSDPTRRAALGACGARLATPDAATRIARNILARLDSAGAQLRGDGGPE